jgi:2-enoate reductase
MRRGSFKLLEPIHISEISIKNRIVMAPIVIMRMTDENGSPTQRAIDFYAERIKGGVGTIITSGFKVEKKIDTTIKGFPMMSEAALSPLSELCKIAHSFNCRVFVQLSVGLGRVAAPYFFKGQPVSASPVPYYWDPNITCRALSIAEVETIVKAFGAAAEIAAEAGADGIEVHGHEGYLLDQFTTGIWNKRKDKYGGNFQNRMTLPRELIETVRVKVDKKFLLIYRYTIKHFMKGLNVGAIKGENYIEAGRDIEEGLEMAKSLEKMGYNALHIDAGCYDSPYWAHPPFFQNHGCLVDLAAAVKKVVNVPVIAVGRLEIPDLAESVIQKGKADLVALGRGLLADPNWPNKIREGRLDDIKRCIGCGDGCSGRLHAGKAVSCAINPACGRESKYRIKKADKSKKVVVVGGGISGMEAARVSALRGHQVILYEKENNLGGLLNAASVPEFKRDLKQLIDWYEIQLRKLGISVNVKTTVNQDLLDRANPNILFIATGSKPKIPLSLLNLPGIRNPNVVISVDLLLNKAESGSSVIVIGGGLVGCEIALWLSQQKKHVTIIEKLPDLMSSGLPVLRVNKLMLIDLLTANKVNTITKANLKEITDEGVVIVDQDQNLKEIKADTVVLAVGQESEDEIYESLDSKSSNLYMVGDCQKPSNIMNAIWSAYEVARAI